MLLRHLFYFVVFSIASSSVEESTLGSGMFSEGKGISGTVGMVVGIVVVTVGFITVGSTIFSFFLQPQKLIISAVIKIAILTFLIAVSFFVVIFTIVTEFLISMQKNKNIPLIFIALWFIMSKDN